MTPAIPVDEMSSGGSSSAGSLSIQQRYQSALSSKEDVCDPECEAAPETKPRPPVAPRGEVVLLVGPAEHEVRVHALILGNASPVFASMLRAEEQTTTRPATFGECAAVRAATASSPARIPLPEDDPAALETICRVLHGRVLDGSGNVSGGSGSRSGGGKGGGGGGGDRSGPPALIDLSPAEVLAVAIAADKYDCAAALALAVEHWLAPGRLEGTAAAVRDDCVGFRRCDLLLASYWLKHEKTFEELTRMLIVGVAGSYEVLVDGREWVDEQLALKLALALETKRNNLRLTLYQVIMERIHIPFFNTPRPRFWWRPAAQPETIDAVLRAIDRDIFSRGMGYMSIGDAIRQAVEIPAVAYNRMSSLRKKYPPGGQQPAPAGPFGKERRRKPQHKALMEKGVEQWEREKLGGLCLACLHPQMKCAKEGHDRDEGRAEWERAQWGR